MCMPHWVNSGFIFDLYMSELCCNLNVTTLVTIMTNSRFAISLHILTLLSYMKEKRLSSDYIAKSINVNPVVVRREISNLLKNGLVESTSGRNGGSALAKSPEKIQLSDIYKAVHPTPVLGTMRETPNPKCPVGSQINTHLDLLFDETEQAILKKLKNRTLSDFSSKFK